MLLNRKIWLSLQKNKRLIENMAQNNTIHNILEVVVGTADIRSSKKDLRHLRNLRDKTTKNKSA